MSAFVVSKEHIDALVTAGLYARPNDGVRWMWPQEPTNDRTHEEGSPWGPEYIDDLEARRRQLTFETAEQVGQMLWAENVRSVNHRYAEEEWEQVYQFPMTVCPVPLSPVAVLKALKCYEYQSCEHPGWATSEAKVFCDALRHHVIGLLPGYDEAEWEVTTNA